MSEKSKENTTGGQKKNDSVWHDERFSHLVSDPRFKHLSKFERKVNIDKRFKGMFNDDKFKVKYPVDKYGRKTNKTSSEDLKKYYEIDSSDEEEQIKEQKNEEAAILTDNNDEADLKSDVDDDHSDLDAEEVPLTLKEKLLDTNVDYARGEGRLLTDSSSDEEEDEDTDDELFIEHVWGELDNDAGTTEESSKRLAVCNMDWDRIRSVDIMVLCNSFLPPGGTILSVKIYPSEFGKERLAHEELHGPQELTMKHTKLSEDIASISEDELVKEDDSDIEEGEDYHMEKLRQYQLNRLRYYYAVIECDTIETADKIYKECDGIEYESTAMKLDLRFIPDDTNFDDDEPRDTCFELPDLHQYKPRIFKNTALQQAKVELTWDETCVERRELGDKLSTGKINEVTDSDLRKLVAYSSEEEEKEVDEKEDSENDQQEETNTSKEKTLVDDPIAKYKSLLQEINKKEEEKKKSKFEMEYSWGLNTSTSLDEEKSKNLKNKSKAELTPIERALEKRSEKNKKRKEERKQRKRRATFVENGKISENYNSESDDDSPDDIDMNDPYFAEEFANGDFEAPKSKSIVKSSIKSKKRNMVDVDEKQKCELELLMNDEDDEKNHFSLEKIQLAETQPKSKRKRKAQLTKSKRGGVQDPKSSIDDNFEIDIKDNRFKAVYDNHLFNIDPTDSHFKKTKGMEKIIDEKLRQRHGSSNDIKERNYNKNNPHRQIENNVMIKMLKQKINNKING